MTDVVVNEFKGYSTFVEIDNKMLRAYNQWSVLYNMKNNKLFQLMEDYLGNLSIPDKLGIQIIAEYISHHGLEETKRELTLNGTYTTA